MNNSETDISVTQGWWQKWIPLSCFVPVPVSEIACTEGLRGDGAYVSERLCFGSRK